MFLGLIIAILGLLLAFFGGAMIRLGFGMVFVLCITFIIDQLMLRLLQVEANTPVGIVILVLSVVVALWLGYHASKVADLYAVPFFSGLIAFSVLSWSCEVIGIHDTFYVREALEFFAFIFGLYLGMQIQSKIKMLVTSILGSGMAVFGCYVTFGLIPINEDAVKSTVYLSLSILLALASFFYQRHQLMQKN